MSSYAEGADFYDLIYADKDYPAESEIVARAIRRETPDARSVLDVGCGTGRHARALADAGFEVDGVDVEPRFVEAAAARCPEGRFSVGDMRSFDLGRSYDAVVCLFSAIGYVRDVDGLNAALSRFAAHLRPGGCVVVDPWFEPGALTDGHVATLTGADERGQVVRMSRTVVQDRTSLLEFEYLIGTKRGIERRSELHELGLFTQAEMEAAFCAAGLSVRREEDAPRTRGIYVGRLGDGRSRAGGAV